MPITEAQRLARRNAVGASDVSKIIGADPYGSAYDVWLEKTGRLPDGQASNDAAEVGNRLESAVIGWAEEQIGAIERDVEITAPDLHLKVHLDGQHLESDRPVEAKTSGLLGPLRENWGEYGSDDVPDRVIVQANVQMLVAKADLCYVPALIGGRGFTMYEIPFDADFAGRLAERVIDFWENHVQADVPPDGIPSIDNLYRRVRQPNKIVPIDPALIAAWEQAQDAVSAAKDIEKAAKAAVLTACGDAEAGEWGDPDRIFTFMQQTRKEYVVKATTFRVPRIVKRKKGV